LFLCVAAITFLYKDERRDFFAGRRGGLAGGSFGRDLSRESGVKDGGGGAPNRSPCVQRQRRSSGELQAQNDKTPGRRPLHPEGDLMAEDDAGRAMELLLIADTHYVRRAQHV
jgi:hypothetical protein